MVAVRPFRALRPPSALAPRVSAPPYDVVDAAEARALADGNPDSFLRISRPEIDLPPDVDPSAEEVHAHGRARLEDFVLRGTLVADRSPGFFIYQQLVGPFAQTGVVCCPAVTDYLSGAIRTHEHTRPDKEADRARHLEVLGAHDEPVLLMSPPHGDLEALIDKAASGAPEFDFSSDDGVRHRLWTVPEPDLVTGLRAAFAEIPRLYLADGHHRSAAAARVYQARRAQGLPETGDEEFLAVVFPARQLRIMAYNRVVRDLAGHSPEELLAALERDFTVTPADRPVEPEHRHGFGIYLAGRWSLLTARPGLVDDSDPVRRLDVAVLQDRVLGPLLGIPDPRTDPRIGFVGGIRGTAELVRLVDAGRAAVAFSLHPTGVDELLAVADRGQVMPPKSTWFEPKLRSGLFLHPFTPPFVPLDPA